jgi:hypothetical protein
MREKERRGKEGRFLRVGLSSTPQIVAGSSLAQIRSSVMPAFRLGSEQTYRSGGVVFSERAQRAGIFAEEILLL